MDVKRLKETLWTEIADTTAATDNDDDDDVAPEDKENADSVRPVPRPLRKNAYCTSVDACVWPTD